jgi:glycosyltransferase involved in cell wall biosynthesis
LKVAFDIQPLLEDEKTGVGHCEAGFIQNMVSRHPETVFTLEYFSFKKKNIKKKNVAVYIAPNVEISNCGKIPGALYRFFSAMFPLPYKWFFKTGVDVTHFFNAIVPPFVEGRKVVTIHDMVIRRFPQTMNSRTRILLGLSLHKTIRRADIIVTDSEFSKKEILKYYNCPINKIKVVYPGIDLKTYHTGINPEEIRCACDKYHIKGQYILYLGTLEPRKNIERLIEAYAQMRDRRTKPPMLVIAGKKGWRFDGIFHRIKDLGLQDRVIFTGYVSDRDKPGLLAGARLFCFPSLYEGFGLPPLEAMACGTPALVSGTASLPEIVGDAALLVDPYSVKSIAQAMEQLCYNTASWKDLREKGLRQVRRFDLEKSSESLYSLYENLAVS